jgi:hypothetical protein
MTVGNESAERWLETNIGRPLETRTHARQLDKRMCARLFDTRMRETIGNKQGDCRK